QPADRVRSDHAIRDRAAGEPRRPLPRRLSGQEARVRDVQYRDAQGRGRLDGRAARADPADARRIETGDRGAEGMTRASFKVWRRDPAGGHYDDYTVDVVPGMVVLDAVHQIQATQAPDLAVRWNCKAGKCGSCSAEINGSPRLMCMTRLNTLDLLH